MVQNDKKRPPPLPSKHTTSRRGGRARSTMLVGPPVLNTHAQSPVFPNQSTIEMNCASNRSQDNTEKYNTERYNTPSRYNSNYSEHFHQHSYSNIQQQQHEQSLISPSPSSSYENPNIYKSPTNYHDRQQQYGNMRNNRTSPSFYAPSSPHHRSHSHRQQEEQNTPYLRNRNSGLNVSVGSVELKNENGLYDGNQQVNDVAVDAVKPHVKKISIAAEKSSEEFRQEDETVSSQTLDNSEVSGAKNAKLRSLVEILTRLKPWLECGFCQNEEQKVEAVISRSSEAIECLGSRIAIGTSVLHVTSKPPKIDVVE